MQQGEYPRENQIKSNQIRSDQIVRMQDSRASACCLLEFSDIILCPCHSSLKTCKPYVAPSPCQLGYPLDNLLVTCYIGYKLKTLNPNTPPFAIYGLYGVKLKP